MLVVDNNKSAYFWSRSCDVQPLNYHGEVVIVFDPSKTNCAMFIGTPTGEEIYTIEFSGNNRRRGPVEDTTMYCAELRAFLSQFLQNVTVYVAAIEQAILVKNSERKKNFNYNTTMTLTEIRSTLCGFFIDQFNVKVLEINNWSWKSHVLPQGYRSQSEKGSKRFIRDYYPDSPLNYYFEADMTDCYCIYLFVVDSFCSNYTVFCNKVEVCNYKLETWLCPVSMPLETSMPSAVYNDRYSLEDNLAYYANRIAKPFVMRIPVNILELQNIYGHISRFTTSNMEDEFVKVVCKRVC